MDTTHATLQHGARGDDRIWRQTVTILDAQAGGCDLFDIDELRLEYNPDQFENLLMCGFIDETASIFPLALLQRCMVDAMVEWVDVQRFLQRPYGYKPVWVGYDPSLSGDSAGCVVLAAPLTPGGKFRVLETHQFRGMDFKAQAQKIEDITQRYAVAYIGVDATGMGQGVFQLVKQFFPAARAYTYSIEVKTRLIMKTLDVIQDKRLEFDAGETGLAQALMAIRKTMTASGRNVTYDAGRARETGHADLAWALMNALDYEPLAGASAQQAMMEIYT